MVFGNKYDWLNLEKLIDTTDNKLSIYISQTKNAKVQSECLEKEKNEEIRKLLSKTMQIVPDVSQIYRIHFDNYLVYQTRNESYAYNDNSYETRRGQGLILFEKSQLLEYTASIVDIEIAKHMMLRNELKHYGVYTLNNIIDVISFNEPIIEKVVRIL